MTRGPLLILIAALLLAGCENPIAYETDHLEAVEVVLRAADGAELARTVENRTWTGVAADGLGVSVGEALDLRVGFVTLDGREVGLTSFDGVSLRAEWEPEGFAVHEPLDTLDLIHGLRPGTTSLRLLAWHGDHADFATPPIPVTVTAQPG
jgi:hypothetical protein